MANHATLFDAMHAHLTTHAYKRGQFKGDAPADQYRRSANHKRIKYNPQTDTMDLVLYSATLVRARRDGSYILDSAGWRTNTTKDTMHLALYHVKRLDNNPHYRNPVVYSATHRGCSQWFFQSPAFPSYAFYDGMVITPEHKPANPKPIMRKAIDTTKSKPFNTDPTIRAFFQTLPLLHATLPERRSNEGAYINSNFLIDDLRNPEKWPLLALYYSYQGGWEGYPKLDLPSVVRAIKTEAKRHMYHRVECSYTSI